MGSQTQYLILKKKRNKKNTHPHNNCVYTNTIEQFHQILNWCNQNPNLWISLLFDLHFVVYVWVVTTNNYSFFEGPFSKVRNKSDHKSGSFSLVPLSMCFIFIFSGRGSFFLSSIISEMLYYFERTNGYLGSMCTSIQKNIWSRKLGESIQGQNTRCIKTGLHGLCVLTSNKEYLIREAGWKHSRAKHQVLRGLLLPLS